MRLVAGHLTTRTTVGRIAEFCPICREIRACHAIRVKSRLYANLIPLEPVTPVALEALCESCGHSFATREEEYVFLSSDFRLDLTALICATHPGVAAKRVQEIALGDRVRRGEVSGEERPRLIQEAFRLLDPTARRLDENSRVDAPAMSALAAFLLSLGSAGLFLPEARSPGFGLRLIPWGALVLGRLGFAVYFAATGRARYMRRHVDGKLALALHPLRPDHFEVVAATDALAREGLFIARHVDARRSAAILQRAESRDAP